MRTAQLKIDGKIVEGVLMSGGFGAQVYSVSGVKGVVLKIGRRIHVVHEDVPAFKCVMRFVNMKYQPLNEQDAVLAEFRGLVKELKGEETEMAKVKNPKMEPTLPGRMPPYIVVYDINDKHYYLTTYPEAQLEHLKTDEKKRSWKISKRGDSEEINAAPTPRFYQDSWNEKVKQDFKGLGLQVLGDFECDDYLPLAVIQEIAGLLNPIFEIEELEMAKVKNPCKRNPTKPYSEMSREELEAEKRAALSLLKSLTRGSALYEDTMRDLGKINRELESLGDPSTLTEFSRRRNPAMTKKKYLHLWERPSNYAGPDWSDYYVLFEKSRDDESYDILKLSNFDVALERLGGENEENGVLVIRDRHWAVGWIEYILVHKDSKKVAEAEKIMKDYDAYPVLDESHYSEAQQEYLIEVFKNYFSDFLHELMSFLGDERNPNDIKGKEMTDAENIISSILDDASFNSGAENAYVSEREIKYWIEGGQGEYFYDKNNVWYKRLIKQRKRSVR